MKHETVRVYGVCRGGGGGEVIVSLLARDKRTYHSHNRDFYLRLVAIGTYSSYSKITLKTHTDYSKAVRGSGTTTINLYATPWQTP